MGQFNRVDQAPKIRFHNVRWDADMWCTGDHSSGVVCGYAQTGPSNRGVLAMIRVAGNQSIYLPVSALIPVTAVKEE